MLEQIKEFYYVFLAGILVISVIGSVIGIKIKNDTKLSKHDDELGRINDKVTHLDNMKQSAKICEIFQKEMKDDIKTMTGTLQVIQVSSIETQKSIARIEGRLNGKG